MKKKLPGVTGVLAEMRGGELVAAGGVNRERKTARTFGSRRSPIPPLWGILECYFLDDFLTGTVAMVWRMRPAIL